MSNQETVESMGVKLNPSPINASEGTSDLGGAEFIEIATSSLVPGNSQPRHRFDQEALESLALSISNFGVIQPIIVKPAAGGSFEIIAGERRWRAAQIAGKPTLPCIVRHPNEEESLEVALIENLQRENLTPIEEANAMAQLVRHHRLTHDELSQRLGVPRVSVTHSLRLLQLPNPIQDLIHTGKLSAGHGKALLMVGIATQQHKLAQLIVEKGLSVRNAESLAKSMGDAKDTQPRQIDQLSPNLRHLCDQYKGHLGTKVKIAGDQQRGRIEISYYSSEDLDRITELVLGSGDI